ncbi:MAG: hypothetical protein ACK5WR_10580 [Planctomycetaceae bacterium]
MSPGKTGNIPRIILDDNEPICYQLHGESVFPQLGGSTVIDVSCVKWLSSVLAQFEGKYKGSNDPKRANAVSLLEELAMCNDKSKETELDVQEVHGFHDDFYDLKCLPVDAGAFGQNRIYLCYGKIGRNDDPYLCVVGLFDPSDYAPDDDATSNGGESSPQTSLPHYDWLYSMSFVYGRFLLFGEHEED